MAARVGTRLRCLQHLIDARSSQRQISMCDGSCRPLHSDSMALWLVRMLNGHTLLCRGACRQALVRHSATLHACLLAVQRLHCTYSHAAALHRHLLPALSTQ